MSGDYRKGVVYWRIAKAEVLWMLKRAIHSGVEIYCDDFQEGKWFANLSPVLANSPIQSIGRRGGNPPEIERLLRYDRPDIIVTVNKQPKLVIEKTSEVPTGHNVGQRFGRIANAVEEQVMVVFFLPFAAKKHGRYANECYIPARFFMALEKMEKIHKIPALAVNWPCDTRWELIRDGSQDEDMKRLLEDLIKSNFVYSESRVIKELRNIMEKEKEARAKAQPSTAKPPPTVKIWKTAEYVEHLGKICPADFQAIPLVFFKREETVVYKLGMTIGACRRTDPYTGTQFLYDYLWCRNGPNPQDKYRNLVLEVPHVPKDKWMKANPNDPSKKTAVYYATANIIVLRDGLLPCHSLVGPMSQGARTLDFFVGDDIA